MSERVKQISVTGTAPVNIAVIKYWGKRDEELVLPINSSLSITLNQKELCAKTTVTASCHFKSDQIWLNGKEESVSNPRIQNLLRYVRSNYSKQKSSERENIETWGIHICSCNNFPTAAGLASSAAGYACLAYTLSDVFGLQDDHNISSLARRGSGSACRSILGGFVEWQMGQREDGSDSIAVQIADENHWKELRVLVLVVSDNKKSIGSSAGMQQSVRTSDLIKHRADISVPQRMNDMKTAILEKDFETFAEITMKDSNQFHAICLDTYPPIFYLNETSKQVIQMVHQYNRLCGQTKVAYTFDAGPNACLYALERDVPDVLSLICHCFPQTDSQQYIKGIQTDIPKISQTLSSAILEMQEDALKYIIHTSIGPGPQILDNSEDSLLGHDGLPKCLTEPS